MHEITKLLGFFLAKISRGCPCDEFRHPSLIRFVELHVQDRIGYRRWNALWVMIEQASENGEYRVAKHGCEDSRLKLMPHPLPLSLQVFFVEFTRRDLDWDFFNHLQSETINPVNLLGVVGHDAEFLEPQVTQDL